MKEVIHFAHGNGFPSACYKQLFRNLGARYDCHYIEKIGHDPRFPVTDNWEYLIDELIVGIKASFSHPIIGLGHSFGGVLNLLAAIKEPALFKCVVMIDSPLLGQLKSMVVRLAKSLGMIDRLTPAFRTKGRLTHWDSKDHLRKYLKSRPLFKTFNEQCLQDYIDFGFKPSVEGYQLVFDKTIEYLIFRTIPHHLFRYEGQLTVPTALIYGTKSNVVSRFDVRYMQKKFHIQAYPMKGTHMLPMEHPEQLGQKIVQVLDELEECNRA